MSSKKTAHSRKEPTYEPSPVVASRTHAKEPTLKDRPNLFNAIDSFIRANTNFESSVPVNAVIDDMDKCTRLQEIFQSPLQRQLFNMDAALRWALFMRCAPKRALEEGDPAYTDRFDVEAAIDLIAQVYDIGVQEHVWEHFEIDSDDDEEEEEDGPEEH